MTSDPQTALREAARAARKTWLETPGSDWPMVVATVIRTLEQHGYKVVGREPDWMGWPAGSISRSAFVEAVDAAPSILGTEDDCSQPHEGKEPVAASPSRQDWDLQLEEEDYQLERQDKEGSHASADAALILVLGLIVRHVSVQMERSLFPGDSGELRTAFDELKTQLESQP